jgi:hypothetical protein
MIKTSIAIPLFFGIWFVNIGFAAVNNDSKRVEVIDRSQANYLSPENTYYSIHSCLAAGDLDWCDETMTAESLQNDIEMFKKAGIDRSRIFELQKNVKDSFIIDKFNYKDSIVILVDDYGYNGSINRMPLTFVEENGKWKMTNKYSSDGELNKYLYYAPPLFDGKGQRPADVNSFLGYEQPMQTQTELSAGTKSYDIHIYYGKTVDPTTFAAKLNKQDISSLFSPQPFSDEEVVIPLPKGRNTLLLSIDGKKSDGRIATDSDRLVFIVP